MENAASRLASRVAIVLVGARNPLNIGAVARAMSNFGFYDLRIVNEYTVSLEDARSAVNAVDLLKNARTFATVAEAVADCALVYGTTAVGNRKPEQPVDFLPQILPHVVQTEGNVAILFGSEKTGLSNDTLSHCQRLLTIPMHVSGVSMNLGQAVAVCLYELVRTQELPPPVSTDSEPANAAQMQILDALLRETLETAGYMERFPGNADPQTLRKLTRHLNMTSRDLPVWLGFFRQILWKIRGSK